MTANRSGRDRRTAVALQFDSQRNRGRCAIEQVGQFRLRKGGFHLQGRVIQPAMQRAQVRAVRLQAQRTGVDALQRVHGIDHIQHGDLRRVTRELVAAAQPALTPHQARLGK